MKIPPLFTGSNDTNAKPTASAQKAEPTTGQTAPSPAQAAPVLTGEALLQRLRYFENLVEQKDQYIQQLRASITRQGGAVPTAYFAPLSGPGGTYTPKAG